MEIQYLHSMYKCPGRLRKEALVCNKQNAIPVSEVVHFDFHNKSGQWYICRKSCMQEGRIKSDPIIIIYCRISVVRQVH
jgi:hypothetical protein